MDAMNPAVSTLSPTDSVRNAYEMMLDRGFKGIPIVNDGRLVGIVTMSDVVNVPRETMDSKSLAHVMTKGLVVASPEESLYDVMNKMTNNQVGRLPVVSKDTGRLLGIVSRTDVMRAYDRAVDLIKQSEKTS